MNKLFDCIDQDGPLNVILSARKSERCDDSRQGSFEAFYIGPLVAAASLIEATEAFLAPAGCQKWLESRRAALYAPLDRIKYVTIKASIASTTRPIQGPYSARSL